MMRRPTQHRPAGRDRGLIEFVPLLAMVGLIVAVITASSALTSLHGGLTTRRVAAARAIAATGLDQVVTQLNQAGLPVTGAVATITGPTATLTEGTPYPAADGTWHYRLTAQQNDPAVGRESITVTGTYQGVSQSIRTTISGINTLGSTTTDSAIAYGLDLADLWSLPVVGTDRVTLSDTARVAGDVLTGGSVDYAPGQDPTTTRPVILGTAGQSDTPDEHCTGPACADRIVSIPATVAVSQPALDAIRAACTQSGGIRDWVASREQGRLAGDPSGSTVCYTSMDVDQDTQITGGGRYTTVVLGPVTIRPGVRVTPASPGDGLFVYSLGDQVTLGGGARVAGTYLAAPAAACSDTAGGTGQAQWVGSMICRTLTLAHTTLTPGDATAVAGTDGLNLLGTAQGRAVTSVWSSDLGVNSRGQR